ncbi:hypothetical protein HK100_011809 [Physocladia obscura]|uniref:NADH:flavin oxidoreductase/NADH oxidase N-terminal domain-containing protein n=1 Tax=Physocladia obscura TaxID=109957 RepID=A0AAD5T1B8_9FUNG|nr:hypothetical protein HK100_011809 [Physocladia obscura]
MSVLFEPIVLGDISLKNRIVLAPLTRQRADENSVPNDLIAEYYEQRASDGGLLISEATPISVETLYTRHVPGIYNQAQIDAWKKITSRVHAKGGKIVQQLWHIGYHSNPDFDPLHRAPPSASVIEREGKPTSRALEEDEIKEIVATFAQAAKNSIEAGFDGVEIHGANTYLIDQFLNESTNKRTDKYGGSIENRNRFALEVTEAVIAAVGAGKTGIRLSPWAINPENKDVSQWISLLKSLNPLKLAYVHFLRSTPGVNNEPETEDVLSFRKAYEGNLILNRGYVAASAEKTINDGNADLIAFGKLFITNPDLVERIKLGRELDENLNFKTLYSGDGGDPSNGYTTYQTWEQAHA